MAADPSQTAFANRQRFMSEELRPLHREIEAPEPFQIDTLTTGTEIRAKMFDQEKYVPQLLIIGGPAWSYLDPTSKPK